MSDVTEILSDIEQGDPTAADQLLPLVYDELRKLATARLAQEKAGQTLQATALVHEAYIRLVDVEQAQKWDSRRHFFAAAAEAMRRILVDNARRRRRPKHGGDRNREEIDDQVVVTRGPTEDLVALDEALDHFSEVAPTKAQLVKLRYFGGMTIEQAAETLDISRATAERYWNYARVWLYSEMSNSD